MYIQYMRPRSDEALKEVPTRMSFAFDVPSFGYVDTPSQLALHEAQIGTHWKHINHN